MMQYIWRRLESTDVDEPTEIYACIDGERREVQRVEVYPNGHIFACGGDRGNEDALNPEPYPKDLRELPGKAYVIPSPIFFEMWMAAQEQPDDLMGMFM